MNVDCVRTTGVRSGPQMKARPILDDIWRDYGEILPLGVEFGMCQLRVTVVVIVLQVEIPARLVRVLLLYSPHIHFFGTFTPLRYCYLSPLALFFTLSSSLTRILYCFCNTTLSDVMLAVLFFRP
jgi:hypothetical protein